MSLKDWLMISIPAIVSIIGFIWTYCGIKRQFKNSMKQSIFEQKKNLYIEAVVLMEELTDDFRMVERTDTENKLRRVIAELDIFGKRDVVTEFRTFGTAIVDHCEEYKLKMSGNEKSVDGEVVFKDMQNKYLYEMQNSINIIIELMRADMDIK